MAKNPSFFDVSEPNTRKRAPAPHMRKSCQFCRSRKTRCSGGLICNACHSRNISCVYGRESQKGRPRTSATESNPFGRSFARKLNEKGNDDCGSSYSSESARSAPSSSPAARTPQENLFADLDLQQINPGCGFPSNTSRTECPLFNETSSIGIGLQRTFKRAFGLNLDLRTPAANERCTLQALNPKPPDRFPTHLLSNSKQCFSTLIQGLLEQSVRRFGCLAPETFDDSPISVSNWFQSTLVHDRPSCTFNPPNYFPSTESAFQNYSRHHVSQLLEFWFQHHPLSLVISKTLILQGYHHTTHDQDLLRVMVAYALNVLDPDQNFTAALELNQAAFHNIWFRPPSQSPLSTSQILLLLGWHHTSQGEVRQGYCFVAHARNLMIESYAYPNARAAEEHEWINGVEVLKVEQELRQNIYWMSSVIELWMAMHMNMPFQETTPNLVEFPCSNESSSSVVTLDRASGNVASLRNHWNSLRQLWAAAHVTTVIAAIYALHPKPGVPFTSSVGDDWQSEIVRKLRYIPHQPLNIRSLYGDIRNSLDDGMAVFKREMGSDPAGILVISTVQILLVHFQFPRPNLVGENLDPMNEKFVVEILNSITNLESLLLAYNQALAVSRDKVLDENSPLLSDCAAILIAGLDTCSRSLEYLYTRCFGTGHTDILGSRGMEVLRLMTSLEKSCSGENLQATMVGFPSLSDVKRRLSCGKKKFVEKLQIGSSQSHGRPTPSQELYGVDGNFLWGSHMDFTGQISFDIEQETSIGDGSFVTATIADWPTITDIELWPN